MKILGPKDYKLQNPNAFLDDYLAYLEEATKEAEETLQNATAMKLDESILLEIQKEAEEIFNMALLVEGYMGQIVLNSVNTLSLPALQSYFNFDNENRSLDEQREQLKIEQKNIQSRLETIGKKIEQDLYENGRVAEFYQAEDTQDFFKVADTPHEFLKCLLQSFSTMPSTEDTFPYLKLQIIDCLKTECKIQNIELSSEEIEDLSEKIIDLFKKSKNIIRYSKDAQGQLANVILSESGISQILPDTFEEKTSLSLMIDLMNLAKLKTTFYTNLPASLQEKLASERLEGKTYEILYKTYHSFLSDAELPSDDLSLNEKEEQKELMEKLSQIEYKLTCLSAEKESHKRFLDDEEAMRSVLREMILGELAEQQITADSIDSIIKDAESKNEKLKADLVKASTLLSTKTSDAEKAQAILLSPDYHYFFQSVERNNVRRLYRAFGVNVTEEVIFPILEEEKRRYEQIDIMVTLENQLTHIYETITEKEKKSNFITRALSSYKESMSTLEKQYQDLIIEAFKKLKEQRLFSINAPKISNDSTVGNVILLPEIASQEPSYFGDLEGIQQSFWNMPTGVDENTKQKFLSMNSQFDTWEDFYQNLMETQKELITKLFSFDELANGFYYFDSSESEREKLKHIQTLVIEVLSSIYDERKSFRQNLGETPDVLEEDKVEEIEYFLGSGSNLSRENLASYIENARKEIEELKSLLARNQAYCTKLGIELPEGITPIEVKEDNSLEEKIKSLNIDGVTTLEEAIAYRNLLLGIEEYTVPPTKVKQFYLEHKKGE